MLARTAGAILYITSSDMDCNRESKLPDGFTSICLERQRARKCFTLNLDRTIHALISSLYWPSTVAGDLVISTVAV